MDMMACLHFFMSICFFAWERVIARAGMELSGVADRKKVICGGFTFSIFRLVASCFEAFLRFFCLIVFSDEGRQVRIYDTWSVLLLHLFCFWVGRMFREGRGKRWIIFVCILCVVSSGNCNR